MTPTSARILILGGQGAFASAEFHQRLVRHWAHAARPLCDEHYPQILHLSTALPGLDLQGLVAPSKALDELIERVEQLKSFAPSLIALPCNSLHVVAPALEAHTGIPVVSPLTRAARTLASQASTLVLASSVLRESFARLRSSVEVAGNCSASAHLVELPDDETARQVDAVIADVVAGKIERAKATLTSLLAGLLGAHGKPDQRVLLACTELSTAAKASDWNGRVVDTMDLLVQACTAELLRVRAGSPKPYSLLP